MRKIRKGQILRVKDLCVFLDRPGGELYIFSGEIRIEEQGILAYESRLLGYRNGGHVKITLLRETPSPPLPIPPDVLEALKAPPSKEELRELAQEESEKENIDEESPQSPPPGTTAFTFGEELRRQMK